MTWTVDTHKRYALHSVATGLVYSAHLLVGSVEGVGIVRLGTHHPGHLVDEAHLLAHLEALVEGIDVAQVAPRDDDPVGHLPVELLADLNGSGLLALQSQAAAQRAESEGCRDTDGCQVQRRMEKAADCLESQAAQNAVDDERT